MDLPVDLISERTGLFEPVLYLCLPYFQRFASSPLTQIRHLVRAPALNLCSKLFALNLIPF